MSASDFPLFNNTHVPVLSADVSTDPTTVLRIQISLVVINAVLMLFTLAILLTRLYVRRNLLHNVGWDDYICTLAAIGSIIHLMLIIISLWVRFGRDSEIAYSTFLLDPLYMQLSNSTQIVYPLAMYWVKLSILLLYKRVFTISRPMNNTINVGITIMAILYALYLCFGIISTIRCNDVRISNQILICRNVYDVILSQDVVNLLTDIFVLVLPFRTIKRLQLQRRQKLGVMAIFGVGLIPCLASLTRCLFLLGTKGTGILLWNNTLVRFFAATEINMAIIAACIPTLPAFITHVKQSIRARNRSSIIQASWRPDTNHPGTIELSESKEALKPHVKRASHEPFTELDLQDQYLLKDEKTTRQELSPSTITR